MKKSKNIDIGKGIIAVVSLVLVVAIVNIWFYKSFKSQATEINDYVKEQTVGRISEFYEQINSLILSMVNNEELVSMQNFSDKKEIYRSNTVRNLINQIVTVNGKASMIKKAYIFIEDIELVICSSGIVEPDMFYEITAKEYFDSYEEWRKTLSSDGLNSSFFTGDNGISFTFLLNNKNILNDNKRKIILGAFVDKESVFVKTPYIEWINESNIYVYDRGGRLSVYNENIVIDSLPQKPSYEKLSQLSNKYELISYDVQINDVSYDVIVVFKKNIDMNMVKTVQVVSILTIFITIFFVFCFIYDLFVKRFRPFIAISELLGIDIDKIDYRLLEKPIKNVLDKNTILNNMLEQRDTHLRTLILRKLLTGDVNKDVLIDSERMGIQFEYNGFVVILVYLYKDSDITEEENFKLIKALEDAIKGITDDGEGIPYFVPINQYIVCIYNTDESSDLKKIGLSFAYLIKFLEKDFDFVASVAVSDLHTKYWEISNAYAEALEVIGGSELFDKSKVVFYKDMTRTGKRYRFNIKDEAKLTAAIRSGNSNAADKIITDIINKIEPEKTILYTNVSIGLVYSLIRIADMLFDEDYDTSSVSNMLKDTNDVNVLRNACCNFAEKMCNDIQKMTNENNFAKKIKEYIHNNYQNPQLSATNISESLEYSFVYLNNTFKKEYNTTMISYLNSYRIEKAKELILQGRSISDAAEMVGILSIRTFNRLFQNITTMTPTEFKNKNARSGE